MKESRFYSEILDDALAIADRASGKLVLLNAAAGLIWLQLQEQPASIKVLAEAFSTLPVLDSSFAPEHLVQRQLEEWAAWGWVKPSDDGVYQLIDEISFRAVDSQRDRLPPSDDWPRLGASIHSRITVCLGRQSLKLEMWFSDALDECAFHSRWSGMLAGLRSSTESPKAIFAYWQRGEDCLLDCNGRLYGTGDSAAATAILFDAILSFAYPEAGSLTTIHAAAVSNARGAILMPAVSGAGKSTLTASLVAKGWRYGGDDIVGVGRDTFDSNELRVLPFPTALGLKEGSWRLLSPDFPQLRSATEVTYNDKRVRFLPVDQQRHIPDCANDRRLQAVVVVNYDPAIPCEFSTLSCSETLAAMTDAGAGTGDEMNMESIATMMEVARTVPAYRLRYSDLTAAERCLSDLP